jgi:hypothetical protein
VIVISTRYCTGPVNLVLVSGLCPTIAYFTPNAAAYNLLELPAAVNVRV